MKLRQTKIDILQRRKRKSKMTDVAKVAKWMVNQFSSENSPVNVSIVGASPYTEKFNEVDEVANVFVYSGKKKEGDKIVMLNLLSSKKPELDDRTRGSIFYFSSTSLPSEELLNKLHDFAAGVFLTGYKAKIDPNMWEVVESKSSSYPTLLKSKGEKSGFDYFLKRSFEPISKNKESVKTNIAEKIGETISIGLPKAITSIIEEGREEKVREDRKRTEEKMEKEIEKGEAIMRDESLETRTRPEDKLPSVEQTSTGKRVIRRVTTKTSPSSDVKEKREEMKEVAKGVEKEVEKGVEKGVGKGEKEVSTVTTGREIPENITYREFQERYEKASSFEDYVRAVLDYLVGSYYTDLILSNDKSLPIFEKAFTHETYNPNSNYEDLELLGDRALDYAFSYYLMKAYGEKIPKNDITTLKSHYMSENFQPKIAESLGMGTRLKARDVKVNSKIFEDLFEAFFGALVTAADNVIPGLGSGLVFNAITKLFENIDIDLEYTKGSEKTQLKEIFERLGIGKPLILTGETADGKIMVTIKMSGDQKRKIEEVSGKKITSMDLGKASARGKSEASNEAHKKAIDLMNRIGIEKMKLQELKDEKDFSIPELTSYSKDLKELRKKYDRIYFKIPRNTITEDGYETIQLMGDKGASREVLASIKSEKNRESASKAELVKSAISSK